MASAASPRLFGLKDDLFSLGEQLGRGGQGGRRVRPRGGRVLRGPRGRRAAEREQRCFGMEDMVDEDGNLPGHDD